MNEYIPRETDFFDGGGAIYDYFLTLPPREGLGRSYLENVAAALHGNAEFQTSGIDKDEDAIQAVNQIESQIYGENEIVNNFRDRLEMRNSENNVLGGLLQDEEEKDTRVKALGRTLFTLCTTQEEFTEVVMAILNKKDSFLGKRFVYLKNASEQDQRVFCEKMWTMYKSEKDAL